MLLLVGAYLICLLLFNISMLVLFGVLFTFCELVRRFPLLHQAPVVLQTRGFRVFDPFLR